MLKKCTICKESKPLEEFPVDRGSKDGKKHCCFVCNRRLTQEYRKKVRAAPKQIPESAQCLECNQELPALNFYKDSARWNGLSGYCKVCDRKIQNKTRAKNREKFRRPIEGTHFCRECKQELHVSRFTIDRAQKSGLCYYCKACQFKQHVALRREVMSHYCDEFIKCACCGIEDIRFLCLDHINGGGAEHRKTVSGGYLYQWLKTRQFPPGFQILCYNCNITKSAFGLCPHEEARQRAKNGVDKK